MNTQNNNNNNENNESVSIILDLESLSAKYKNLLIQYKQAVLNYVNFLKQEADTPCGKYTSISNNIDQECYNEIWKKGGCTQPPRELSSMSGSASVTLDTWILDTFNWATNTDTDSRMGCYGHADSPYLIIGVGKYDGDLYSRPGLSGNWTKINDDSEGNILSVCTGSDGKTIICVNIGNDISIKSSWDAPNWQSPDWGTLGFPCISGTNNKMKFLSIAQAPDGTLVAVGTDHTLWTTPNFQTCWTNVATNTNGNEAENAVCIGPNGRVIIANGADLYYKDSYINLQNQVWQYGGPACCQDITVAPDGKLLDAGGCPQDDDNQLWAMDSYLNLNGGWRGPYPNSCCIKSLTTVANTDLAASGYSTATQPDYKIDSQPLTSIQGQAYWGTGGVTNENPTLGIASVTDCEALCSSTANCTGATFNLEDHGQPMCWLRTGDANPISALPNDYAIIPEGKQLLMIIQDINTQLTSINEEIQKKSNNGQPLYDSQSVQRKIKTKELITQFIELTKEREKIDGLVNKYQTLDQKEESGNININKNMYSFYLLLALAIIIVIILYNFVGSTTTTSNSPVFQSGGGKLGNNAYYIIFGIIFTILFVQLYNSMKHQTV